MAVFQKRDLPGGNSQSSDAAELKQQKSRLDALRVRFDTIAPAVAALTKYKVAWKSLIFEFLLFRVSGYLFVQRYSGFRKRQRT
jgi:hypothetical protein